jgi:phosphoglycolate phosphatase-like HAD superfamily hydrolase
VTGAGLDLVAAAVDTAGGGPAVMLGDSTWDCKAAERAAVTTIGILTGGFAEQEPRIAGAVLAVRELRERLDEREEKPIGHG